MQKSSSFSENSLRETITPETVVTIFGAMEPSSRQVVLTATAAGLPTARPSTLSGSNTVESKGPPKVDRKHENEGPTNFSFGTRSSRRNVNDSSEDHINDTVSAEDLNGDKRVNVDDDNVYDNNNNGTDREISDICSLQKQFVALTVKNDDGDGGAKGNRKSPSADQCKLFMANLDRADRNTIEVRSDPTANSAADEDIAGTSTSNYFAALAVEAEREEQIRKHKQQKPQHQKEISFIPTVGKNADGASNFAERGGSRGYGVHTSGNQPQTESVSDVLRAAKLPRDPRDIPSAKTIIPIPIEYLVLQLQQQIGGVEPFHPELFNQIKAQEVAAVKAQEYHEKIRFRRGVDRDGSSTYRPQRSGVGGNLLSPEGKKSKVIGKLNASTMRRSQLRSCNPNSTLKSPSPKKSATPSQHKGELTIKFRNIFTSKPVFQRRAALNSTLRGQHQTNRGSVSDPAETTLDTPSKEAVLPSAATPPPPTHLKKATVPPLPLAPVQTKKLQQSTYSPDPEIPFVGTANIFGSARKHFKIPSSPHLVNTQQQQQSPIRTLGKNASIRGGGWNPYASTAKLSSTLRFSARGPNKNENLASIGNRVSGVDGPLATAREAAQSERERQLGLFERIFGTKKSAQGLANNNGSNGGALHVDSIGNTNVNNHRTGGGVKMLSSIFAGDFTTFLGEQRAEDETSPPRRNVLLGVNKNASGTIRRRNQPPNSARAGINPSATIDFNRTLRREGAANSGNPTRSLENATSTEADAADWLLFYHSLTVCIGTYYQTKVAELTEYWTAELEENNSVMKQQLDSIASRYDPSKNTENFYRYQRSAAWANSLANRPNEETHEEILSTIHELMLDAQYATLPAEEYERGLKTDFEVYSDLSTEWSKLEAAPIEKFMAVERARQVKEGEERRQKQQQDLLEAQKIILLQQSAHNRHTFLLQQQQKQQTAEALLSTKAASPPQAVNSEPDFEVGTADMLNPASYPSERTNTSSNEIPTRRPVEVAVKHNTDTQTQRATEENNVKSVGGSVAGAVTDLAIHTNDGGVDYVWVPPTALASVVSAQKNSGNAAGDVPSPQQQIPAPPPPPPRPPKKHRDGSNSASLRSSGLASESNEVADPNRSSADTSPKSSQGIRGNTPRSLTNRSITAPTPPLTRYSPKTKSDNISQENTVKVPPTRECKENPPEMPITFSPKNSFQQDTEKTLSVDRASEEGQRKEFISFARVPKSPTLANDSTPLASCSVGRRSSDRSNSGHKASMEEDGAYASPTNSSFALGHQIGLNSTVSRSLGLESSLEAADTSVMPQNNFGIKKNQVNGHLNQGTELAPLLSVSQIATSNSIIAKPPTDAQLLRPNQAGPIEKSNMLGIWEKHRRQHKNHTTPQSKNTELEIEKFERYVIVYTSGTKMKTVRGHFALQKANILLKQMWERFKTQLPTSVQMALTNDEGLLEVLRKEEDEEDHLRSSKQHDAYPHRPTSIASLRASESILFGASASANIKLDWGDAQSPNVSNHPATQSPSESYLQYLQQHNLAPTAATPMPKTEEERIRALRVSRRRNYVRVLLLGICRKYKHYFFVIDEPSGSFNKEISNEADHRPPAAESENPRKEEQDWIYAYTLLESFVTSGPIVSLGVLILLALRVVYYLYLGVYAALFDDDEHYSYFIENGSTDDKRHASSGPVALQNPEDSHLHPYNAGAAHQRTPCFPQTQQSKQKRTHSPPAPPRPITPTSSFVGKNKQSHSQLMQAVRNLKSFWRPSTHTSNQTNSSGALSKLATPDFRRSDLSFRGGFLSPTDSGQRARKANVNSPSKVIGKTKLGTVSAKSLNNDLGPTRDTAEASGGDTSKLDASNDVNLQTRLNTFSSGILSPASSPSILSALSDVSHGTSTSSTPRILSRIPSRLRKSPPNPTPAGGSILKSRVFAKVNSGYSLKEKGVESEGRVYDQTNASKKSTNSKKRRQTQPEARRQIGFNLDHLKSSAIPKNGRIASGKAKPSISSDENAKKGEMVKSRTLSEWLYKQSPSSFINRWKYIWHLAELEDTVYSSVVIVYRSRPANRAQLNCSWLQVEEYLDVPVADVEALLPHKHPNLAPTLVTRFIVTVAIIMCGLHVSLSSFVYNMSQTADPLESRRELAHLVASLTNINQNSRLTVPAQIGQNHNTFADSLPTDIALNGSCAHHPAHDRAVIECLNRALVAVSSVLGSQHPTPSLSVLSSPLALCAVFVMASQLFDTIVRFLRRLRDGDVNTSDGVSPNQWAVNKRIGKNEAIVSRQAGAVCDQESKMILLCYFFLWQAGPSTMSQLQDRIEHFLRDSFPVEMSLYCNEADGGSETFCFDVSMAVSKMLSLGLATDRAYALKTTSDSINSRADDPCVVHEQKLISVIVKPRGWVNTHNVAHLSTIVFGEEGAEDMFEAVFDDCSEDDNETNSESEDIELVSSYDNFFDGFDTETDDAGGSDFGEYCGERGRKGKNDSLRASVADDQAPSYQSQTPTPKLKFPLRESSGHTLGAGHRKPRRPTRNVNRKEHSDGEIFLGSDDEDIMLESSSDLQSLAM